MSDRRKITVYTDGGNILAENVGGYGVLILYPDGRKTERSGGFDSAVTNNQVELFAVIDALTYLAETENMDEVEIELVSDSEYVVNGITKWLPNWVRKNWKGTQGPVKNRELWEVIWKVTRGMPLKMRWTRGHAGDEHNERVDKLAGDAYRSILENRKNQNERK